MGVENYSNLINTGTTCPAVKRPQVFGLGEKAAKERPAQEHGHKKIEKLAIHENCLVKLQFLEAKGIQPQKNFYRKKTHILDSNGVW